MTHGFYISNSANTEAVQHVLQNVDCNYASYGVACEGRIQGLIISDSNLTSVATGIYWNPSTTESSVMARNVQIAPSIRGVYLRRMGEGTIGGCEVLGGQIGIDIESCSLVGVFDNYLQGQSIAGIIVSDDLSLGGWAGGYNTIGPNRFANLGGAPIVWLKSNSHDNKVCQAGMVFPNSAAIANSGTGNTLY